MANASNVKDLVDEKFVSNDIALGEPSLSNGPLLLLLLLQLFIVAIVT